MLQLKKGYKVTIKKHNETLATLENCETIKQIAETALSYYNVNAENFEIYDFDDESELERSEASAFHYEHTNEVLCPRIEVFDEKGKFIFQVMVNSYTYLDVVYGGIGKPHKNGITLDVILTLLVKGDYEYIIKNNDYLFDRLITA